ncbi:MAG: TIGR01440 family protein [Defluviitaleaceae bacterium]|nr:TIGR01440 family protein [Defluviitaleaceae bacterium]
MNLTEIKSQVEQVFKETIEAGELEHGDIIVLGCSSSEILGEHIGKAGSSEVGQAVISAVMDITSRLNLHIAVQCCEHLNRALVVTKSCAVVYNLEVVRVCPTPSAGGSCASVAYEMLPNAVVVEHIKAHAAVDIGDTHIGMHVKFVQVPFRPTIKRVGQAHVTALTSRPKLIGGTRAKYD